jgi:hypothetical protein
MALARCETCGQPKGTKQRYPHAHTATNQTRTEDRRIPCGAPNCSRSALVWLSEAEESEYRRGERSFRVVQHGDVQVT